MKYGLKDTTVEAIGQVFRNFPVIEKAVLYGSRAKGNYRNGSDIDLTLFGDLTLQTLHRIETELDDLLLPYMIDLSIFKQIANPDLVAHIERVGVVFYAKENLSSEIEQGSQSETA